MTNATTYLDTVGLIVQRLEKLGMRPILVGGMALVVLGSRRVTRDFDFVLSLPADHATAIFQIFYTEGFELVSRLNEQGNVVRTIAKANVAKTRVRIDAPDSLFFFNRTTGLRIDLLLDFPLPASELAERAETIKIRSHTLSIACRADLLRLKEMAYKCRKKSSDLQDIEFLKRLAE